MTCRKLAHRAGVLAGDRPLLDEIAEAPHPAERVGLVEPCREGAEPRDAGRPEAPRDRRRPRLDLATLAARSTRGAAEARLVRVGVVADVLEQQDERLASGRFREQGPRHRLPRRLHPALHHGEARDESVARRATEQIGADEVGRRRRASARKSIEPLPPHRVAHGERRVARGQLEARLGQLVGQAREGAEGPRAHVARRAAEPVVDHRRRRLREGRCERLGGPGRVEPERVVLGVDEVEQGLLGVGWANARDRREQRVGEEALVLFALFLSEGLGKRVLGELADEGDHVGVGQRREDGCAASSAVSACPRTVRLGKRKAARSAGTARVRAGSVSTERRSIAATRLA